MEATVHKPVKPIDSKFVALGRMAKRGPFKQFVLLLGGNKLEEIRLSVQMAENCEKAADKHLQDKEYAPAIKKYGMALECLRDAARYVSPCFEKDKAPTMHKRIKAKMEIITAKMEDAIATKATEGK